MHFHTSAIGACPGKRPLRDTAIAVNKVFRIAPVRIGKRRPYLGEAGSDRIATHVSGAAHIWTGRRLEHAVVRHERHERDGIMTIPGISKGVQHFYGDFGTHGHTGAMLALIRNKFVGS